MKCCYVTRYVTYITQVKLNIWQVEQETGFERIFFFSFT